MSMTYTWSCNSQGRY